MLFKTYCRNIVILGTLLIWTVKFFVRPYLHPTGATGFLLGVMPNLAGSFLLPYGAHWLHCQKALFRDSGLRLTSFFETRTVCLLGFALLVVNEYLQLVPFFGRRFDYFDIVFSAVGLTLSYYTFVSRQRRMALLR